MVKSSVSLTDKQRRSTEELDTAALRELLSRRRTGAFVDTEQMNARLAAMVAGKRRVQGPSP